MAEMEKKTVNAMGDVCPVPLVKAKNAIAELAGSGKVEVLVDNEIAVQNLEKMAQQKGYGFLVKEKKEKEYHVEFTVSETEPAETEAVSYTHLDVYKRHELHSERRKEQRIDAAWYFTGRDRKTSDSD